MSERVVTVGGPDPTRLLSEFDRNIAGTEFYVGPNATGVGDDGRSGRSKESSLLTLAKALTLTTASKNDIIYLLPGHAEIIVTAIDVNKIGVNIIGLGNGDLVPTITCNAAIDCMDITVADVRIRNIHFPVSTLTGVTSRINVGAANCVIEDCLFDCGEFDTETITVEAGGDDLTIRDNKFVCDSAATADAAIEIEAAGVDGLQVIDNHFDGYDDTQAWDTGAINSGVAHTRCLIKGNTTLYGPGIIFSDAATGMIVGNYCTEGTLGSMIDPGSCMCIENYESDAVDETGSLFPQASPVGGGIETDVAAILVDTGTTLQTDLDTITDLEERVVKKAAATMVTAQTLFTVAGGPIEVIGLVSICETGNDATASTLQYNATPTAGSAQTISGASGSLANSAAGASVTLAGTALATAALLNANGPNLIANPGTIMVPIGAIDIVIGVGSTTGTWAHYLRYKPLATGVTVT